ncbi:thiamine phosphate synthase [Candidatus Marinamargulisbacteria bacterium SCGC AG-414-C22]|nr:thiamine phosphate synthase [Candidatus Marinamargulisbacteria bacterium SCGC AG-414-C22]
MFDQIIDANLNRATEGLRVIEDYVRFVAQQKIHTDTLAAMRKQIHKLHPQTPGQLHIRDTNSDMRAKEIPQKRQSLIDLLTANFKRVEESLRVLEEYTGNAGFNTLRYDVYELEKEISLDLLKKNIQSGIYLISDNVDVLIKGLSWNVAFIQLRDKHATKKTIYEKALALKKASNKTNIPIIINDHIDIALSLNFDGVHTGQDDIPVNEQRKLLGPHKIIGRTTHSLEQGKIAEKEGADYISVGPIWETPSKPNRDGIGFDYLKQAAQSINIPYVAIGGINKSNIQNVIKHNPPLVGLIRAYEDIPYIQTLISKTT